MDHQLSLFEPPLPPTPSPIGGVANDHMQACNECKRRRGRCDRQLPECGPCARNKRHCLYERHSKTPLTRKHLTDVEERLRQAELRLSQSEYRARLAETKLQHLFATQATQASMGTLRTAKMDPGAAQAPHDLRDRVLEEPPSHAEDFSWDEQDPVVSPTSVQLFETQEAGEPNVSDGMGALSVSDGGTGYLGVASGAALLRLLLPDADSRRVRTHSATQEASSGGGERGWVPTPIYAERRIVEIDLDAAIDSYFAVFHLAYPLVHEPTFRAQYAQVIPRPHGKSWNALAYMIGAVGLFTTATGPISQDVDLFEAAKSNLSIASLETGNITLVQVLTLMSNYIQKRNKPNSGYNYLGLALHMAMGLGLHKEFQNWRIAPLSMEIRRRVWWSLYVFFSGAMITFGRPLSWPSHGIEVALPLNVDDRDLTHASTLLPSPKLGLTAYSAVTAQARFHLATNDIYANVILAHSPPASELLRLDDEKIETWRARWADEHHIPDKFELSRRIMELRYRNLRIIMYRPFLIKHTLQARTIPLVPMDSATKTAIERCLLEAEATITSIHDYWMTGEQNCMASWYYLFYIFQASLIPTIMLRNDPAAELASSWRTQIQAVIRVAESMKKINPASKNCHQVILRLCGDFLTVLRDTPLSMDPLKPVEESPETQITGVYSMLWPNAGSAEYEPLMPDETWTAFLSEMTSVSPSDPHFAAHGPG